MSSAQNPILENLHYLEYPMASHRLPLASATAGQMTEYIMSDVDQEQKERLASIARAADEPTFDYLSSPPTGARE
jgi:hypothetical protein